MTLYIKTLHDMNIVDMEWAPNKPLPALFIIHCDCDTRFSCDANWRGLVKCPGCGAEDSLRILYFKWKRDSNGNLRISAI
jgi:hypothetical protein